MPSLQDIATVCMRRGHGQHAVASPTPLERALQMAVCRAAFSGTPAAGAAGLPPPDGSLTHSR